MNNILLIGAGYYARRTYLPTIEKISNWRVDWIIDLDSQKDIIQSYLQENGLEIGASFFPNNKQGLTIEETDILDTIVKERSIKAVIISTEPLAHFRYAEWALKRKLNILMDKPVTTEEGVISSENKAMKLVTDYNTLNELYLKEKEIVQFNLMAQRRFHPIFKFLQEKIDEVLNYSNCPVTSIECHHSDGQWRFPDEIIDQDYHPYNVGYGKASHSGYHFIDIITQLLYRSYPKDKEPDNVSVYAQTVNPRDVITQFNHSDYLRLFQDKDFRFKYSPEEYKKITNGYGEIDIFSIIQFKRSTNVVSTCTINLLHNGVSQRSWINANGKDLYKGNGRIKQESYIITQGPFQSIVVETFQSKEDHFCKDPFDTKIGNKNHVDIHIFRNSELNPKWQACETYSLNDVSNSFRNKIHSGIQQESRENCIREFFVNIDTNPDKMLQTSDFTSHKTSVEILSSMYLSNQRNKSIEFKL